MATPPIGPAIDPHELRPKRRWYWIAVLIGVLGVLVGVGVGIWLIYLAATGMSPDTRTRLDTHGQEVTGSVRLTAEENWAVFSTTSDDSFNLDCTAKASDGSAPIRMSSSFGKLDFTENGQTWYQAATIRPPQDGTYQITCDLLETAGPSDQHADYMVGEASDFGTFFGGLFGGIAVIFALPTLAVIAAAVIAIVTGVRRGNHKKRLLAQRQYPGYPGGYPGYPGY